MNFLQLFDRYIEYHVQSANIYARRDQCTLTAYRNKGESVAKFLMQSGIIDISPVDFKPKVADQYLEHLARSGYAHNYAARCVHICKTVLRFGAVQELIPFNPLSEYRLRKEPPPPPIHLTPEELNRINQYRPYTSTICKARDMFLFQCYTGMDYGDTVSVRLSNIFRFKGMECIKKRRNKTDVEAIVPLHPVAKEIFERNKYNMKLLSNAKYNEALKELARECEIDKHITTHVGRKTFAMIKLNYEGGNITPLSKNLGHKKVSTTEDYYAQPDLMAVFIEHTRLAI